MTMRLPSAFGAVLLLLAGCLQVPRPTWSASTVSMAQNAPVAEQLPAGRRTKGPAAASLTVRGVADDGPELDSSQRIFSSDDSRYRLDPRSGSESLRGVRYARGLFTPVGESDDSTVSRRNDGEGIVPLIPYADGLGEAPDDDPSFAGTKGSSTDFVEPDPISFREDLKQIPRMLWDDNLSLYNWTNAIVLGVAAGGAVAIRDNLDQRVRQETAEHPLRWGQGSVVLRQFGEYSYQVPVLAGVYAVSLWAEDDKFHEFSLAVISAYSLSAMYTVAIKGITDTSRPTTQFQNGHYGFPSYHSSSTFSIAAVIDEYYGWEVGLPAYVLAGLVGWSRIDQREHDLLDVLFGSVLGFVVGKTVAAAHLERHSNFQVTPYYDPNTRGAGVTVQTKF